MSTTATAHPESATHEHVATRETARRLIERYRGAPGVCRLCFARIRHYADDFVEYLEGDDSLGDYGDVLKTTATSTPEPSTFHEAVPPTSLADEDDPLDRATRWQPSRAKRICQCGVIDYPDADEDRHLTNRERYELVENLADRLTEDDRAFALGQAKETIRLANRRDRLAGRDQDVLEAAVAQGLKHA